MTKEISVGLLGKTMAAIVYKLREICVITMNATYILIMLNIVYL